VLSLLTLVAMGICNLRLDPADEGSVPSEMARRCPDGSGVVLVGASLRAHMATGVFGEQATPLPIYLQLEIWLAAISVCIGSFHFYRYAFRRNSVAFRTLAFSLALWAVLMGAGQMRLPSSTRWSSGQASYGRSRRCCWPSPW